MATKTAIKPPAKTAAAPAPVPNRRTVSVLEFVAATPRVDAEKGVVYGVKLLGRVSKNGHRYSDRALRDAKSVYESNVVNLDHPPNRNAAAERGVRERFGVIRNPEAVISGNDETDGVYGEHHFPLKHSYTPEYLEILDRFPQSVGFSHNAVVTESVQDGKVIFDSVERARSVDLVANPATTRGIFESEGSMNPDDPNYVAPTMEGTPADPEPDAPDTEQSICDALKLAINAILDDDGLSAEQIREKILAILEVKEKLEGDDEPNDKGDEPKDEPPKDEPKDDAASLRDRLTKLEQEIKAKNTLEAAREALEKAGFRPSKVEVKAFAVLESTDERNEFIATLKKANAAPAAAAATDRAKPRSTSIQSLESTKEPAGGKPGASPIKSHDDLKRVTADLFCG